MKALLRPELLGLYVNPDDIEAEIRRHDFFDLAALGIATNESEILEFFRNSTLLAKADLLDEAAQLSFSDGKFSFFAVVVNSYFASVAADFVRQKLLVARRSFTFETVMSSPDKVEFLRRAQRMGFRTYLYSLWGQYPAACGVYLTIC